MTLTEITAHLKPVIWPNMSFSPELVRHSERQVHEILSKMECEYL